MSGQADTTCNSDFNPQTNPSPTQVEKDFKRDFYLSAEESVEYGMVDKVIFPGMKDGLSVRRAGCPAGRGAGGGRVALEMEDKCATDGRLPSAAVMSSRVRGEGLVADRLRPSFRESPVTEGLPLSRVPLC